MKDVLWISGIVVMLAVATLAGNVFFQGDGPSDHLDDTGSEYPGDAKTQFKTFDSFSEMKDFLNESKKLGGEYYSYPNLYYGQYYRDHNDTYRYGEDVVPTMGGDWLADGDGSAGNSKSGSESSDDHSTTNVQEEGVDEGDVVKNDGGYAYIASNDRHQVLIVDVYPPDSPQIVSRIDLGNESIDSLYLQGNSLVVISTYGGHFEYYGYGHYPGYDIQTDGHGVRVKVYDITSRNEPVLIKENEFAGYLIDSRMIGEQLYLIGRQYDGEVRSPEDLPVSVEDVQYIDRPDDQFTYTSVASLDITKKDYDPLVRTMLIGASSEIYASERNIYVTHTAYGSWADLIEGEIEEVLEPILPEKERAEIETTMGSDGSLAQRLDEVDDTMDRYLDSLSHSEKDRFYDEWWQERESYRQDMDPYQERTAIHRISLIDGMINFKASGTVPGYILNRFSMGEYQSHFRIATTTGEVWGENKALNQVYVLDMDLEIVGNITGIAPGERIYSARFIGERGYLVTFQKVDPFFVIDLSDPEYPKILGELKIPGYSDYLHPYDANHVIGLGKDTVEAEEGDFAWYQGVKLSLFDVTDLNNPKELSKYIIGDRGTYSLAQTDPHAFLFSLKKNLLVIPIALYEIEYLSPEPYTYGEYVWSGAYVLDVTTESGFELRGRISNSEKGYPDNDYDYHDNDRDSIYRSFYIDDTIYTVSPGMVKASDMGSVTEISHVDLPYTKGTYYEYYS